MPPWNPIQAICHPERPHKAKGLCHKCYDSRYKRKNPQQHCNNVRRSNLKRLYGITEAEYDAMFTTQNGVCAICRKPQQGKRIKRLAVDHDHVTGKVRGLLCTRCNEAVGKLDNVEWRAAADAYLCQ